MVTDVSGSYSAIWRPYHYIGLELAQSIYAIALDQKATGQTINYNADVAAYAKKDLKEGDTLNVKFASKINTVCKSKGCWMNLDLGNEQESLVKFKDYGFFMPLNSDGREVIVNGKAFVNTTSIEELRHFAKDAGKSEEEIAKITEPKYTLSFEADGVLMVKN